MFGERKNYSLWEMNTIKSTPPPLTIEREGKQSKRMKDIGIIIVVGAVILFILLVFLPLFVFQISGSAQRTERVVRDILYQLPNTEQNESVLKDILYEFKQPTNTFCLRQKSS